LAQIKAKQEEQTLYTEHITGIDAKIKQIKSKFDKELGKLGQSKDQIQQRRADLEAQSARLDLGQSAPNLTCFSEIAERGQGERRDSN